MKILLLAIAGLVVFSAQVMAQDAPQVQQAPKMRPGLNLMGDKQVDPRTEQYRKNVDREYDAALKKIPDQKKTTNDPWASVRSGEQTKR